MMPTASPRNLNRSERREQREQRSGNEWEVEGVETPGSNFSYPISHRGDCSRLRFEGSGNFWIALFVSALVMLGVWGLSNWGGETSEIAEPPVQGIVKRPEGRAPVAAEQRFEQIMALLTALVFAARVIVKITPSQADDTALAGILEFLRHVALHIPSNDQGPGTNDQLRSNVPITNIPATGPTGRAILCMVLAGGLLTGCAWQHTASFNPETHMTETFSQIVWFQKANVEGLRAHQKTKGGGSLAFGVSKEGTETQTEAIKAVAEGVAKGFAEGVKP